MTPADSSQTGADRPDAATAVPNAEPYLNRPRRTGGRGIRSLLLILTALATVTAVCYAVAAFSYYSRHPVLSKNFADELNAVITATPEAQRAWPGYRQALSQLKRRLPDESYASDKYLRAADPARFRALELLHRNADVLPSIRAAAAQPALGFPLRDQHDPDDLAWMFKDKLPGEIPIAKRPSDNPELMAVLLPYITELRSMAELLLLDADEAADTDNGARARDDLVAAINIADQLREVPWLLNDVVSCCTRRAPIAMMTAVIWRPTLEVRSRRRGYLAHAPQQPRMATGFFGPYPRQANLGLTAFRTESKVLTSSDSIPRH